MNHFKTKYFIYIFFFSRNEFDLENKFKFAYNIYGAKTKCMLFFPFAINSPNKLNPLIVIYEIWVLTCTKACSHTLKYTRIYGWPFADLNIIYHNNSAYQYENPQFLYVHYTRATQEFSLSFRCLQMPIVANSRPKRPYIPAVSRTNISTLSKHTHTHTADIRGRGTLC